jgi:hypothetical protein
MQVGHSGHTQHLRQFGGGFELSDGSPSIHVSESAMMVMLLFEMGLPMLCYFLAGAKNVACFFRRPLLRGMMESSPMRAEGMRLI